MQIAGKQCTVPGIAHAFCNKFEALKIVPLCFFLKFLCVCISQTAIVIN